MGLPVLERLFGECGRAQFLLLLFVFYALVIVTFSALTPLLLMAFGMVMNQRLNDTVYETRRVRKFFIILFALFGFFTVSFIGALVFGFTDEQNGLWFMYPVILFFIFVPIYLASAASFLILLFAKKDDVTRDDMI